MRARPIVLLVVLAGTARADPTDLGAPRIELFPSTVMSATLRREGSVERSQADAIEAAGVARVDSGRVPPEWRVAERAIRDAFHPPLGAVTAHSAPRALADQTLRNQPEGPARTRAEPPTPTRGEIDPDDQVEAMQRAMRRARDWRTVVVEVTLGAGGSFESARVATPSDNARLDAAALDAVQQAVADHPVRKAGELRVARFRIAAARAVVPLDVSPVGAPESKARMRGIVPKMRFHFDETTGKVRAERPFSSEIQTDVQLLSLTPAR